MRIAKIVVLFALVCFAGIELFAQQQKSAAPFPPATPITAGQEMFRAYCASCHGLDAKGAGPAASSLKKQPPDLTLLAKHYGKFPSTMVESVIRGDQFVLSHGSREMPVWGEAFRATNADANLAKLKVHNLALYLESIQK